MRDWYDAARKHIKTVLPTNKHLAFGQLMSDWFAAGAPGTPSAVPAATASVVGGVKKGAAVTSPADDTADHAALVSLIASLKASGAIA